MCGLAGYIPYKAASADEMQFNGSKMIDAIFSRGPDDKGVWVEDFQSLMMCFRRLSILDLSPAGHQPMVSRSGRFKICFNGEIYNHLELRQKFNGDWRGHSDTETILEVIEQTGIENALNLLVGMFSIAVWDSQEAELILARDRMGEKPLYYGWVQKDFVFASELKAIKEHPNFNNPISKAALSNYLKFNYIPAPQSIYKDLFKLQPGTFIKIPLKSASIKTITPTKYWDLSEAITNGQNHLIKDSKEALHETKLTLSKSVKSQMISDVPLGAFLSGGIDSSLITAIMQEQSMEKIKTFTIGFDNPSFDESSFAKDVANHLGTDHTEYFVTSQEALDVIPSIPEIYDEPFADSSQIPTHLVCKQAKKNVTVALSGDGGDEIFGGYNRYFWSNKIWSKLRWIPYPARKILGSAIQATPQNLFYSIEKFYNILAPKKFSVHQFSDKLNKLSSRLQFVDSENELYKSLVTQWHDPSVILKDFVEDLHDVEFPFQPSLTDHLPSRMMFWDSLTYLPDDILCKVDRAAMSVSLETRAPFLDHRLIELAWRLPHSLKTNKHEGKIILREILDQYIPRSLIDRPKAGFGIPVGEWLRGPLKSWAEDLLAEDKIIKQGFFYHEPIYKIWFEHQSTSYDHTNKLWSILMFQAWLEAQ